MVKGWLLTGAINQEIQGSELSIAMPDDSLAITPILADASDTPTGIQVVKEGESGIEDTQIYDLLGNKVSTPIPGNVYIQNRKKILFW